MINQTVALAPRGLVYFHSIAQVSEAGEARGLVKVNGRGGFDLIYIYIYNSYKLHI